MLASMDALFKWSATAASVLAVAGYATDEEWLMMIAALVGAGCIGAWLHFEMRPHDHWRGYRRRGARDQ